MKPFHQHRGIAAPLLVDNIDTDQIIPSREMKRVSKLGLGDGLFAGWRYSDDGGKRGEEIQDFVLNQPRYRDATILLAGKNFGCGSSREHAVGSLHHRLDQSKALAGSFAATARGMVCSLSTSPVNT